MFSHGPLLRCVCALKRAKAGYSLEDLATVISSLELWVSPDKKQGEEETSDILLKKMKEDTAILNKQHLNLAWFAVRIALESRQSADTTRVRVCNGMLKYIVALFKNREFDTEETTTELLKFFTEYHDTKFIEEHIK